MSHFTKMSIIKIKINKKKIIPNIKYYLKILLSSFFTVYVIKFILIKLFPKLDMLSTPWDLVVWVLIIVYLKNIIDIKLFGTDYF